MTKKRIKTAALPCILTRKDAEALVSSITELTIKHNLLTSDLDAEIAITRSRYETTLGNLTARIESLTEEIRDWALANPEEFGKKKSLVFSQGVIGFRTGMPKLKTLSGFTFARVLNQLTQFKWGNAFIRMKEEVDKEGLISAFTSKNISTSELREIGVRVDQEETFFVEPDLTETEGKQVTSAKASSNGKEGK